MLNPIYFIPQKGNSYQLIPQKGNSYQPKTQVNTIVNNLRFPGQYYDHETGLHYNLWRYYDAEVGRYLRVDPSQYLNPDEHNIPFLLFGLIKDPGKMNPYTYVENNVLNNFDEKGLITYDQISLNCEQVRRTAIYNSSIAPEVAMCLSAGEMQNCMIENQNDVQISCSSADPPVKDGMTACAEAGPGGPIILYNQSIDTITFTCGQFSLEEIIFHEMIHTCQYGTLGIVAVEKVLEKQAYGCVNKCYGKVPGAECNCWATRMGLN